MTRIFWGFIFIFFTFTLTFNLGSFILAIDLLPDFIGYSKARTKLYPIV